MKNMLLPLDDKLFNDLAQTAGFMGMPRTVLVARLIDFAVENGGVKAVNDSRMRELEAIDLMLNS